MKVIGESGGSSYLLRGFKRCNLLYSLEKSGQAIIGGLLRFPTNFLRAACCLLPQLTGALEGSCPTFHVVIRRS